jgi:LacI family transcriptional regulator
MTTVARAGPGPARSPVPKYRPGSISRSARPPGPLSSFTAGLRDAGLDLDDRFVVEAEFTRAGGYAAARELAAQAGFDLVFAVNDVMAIGAMTAFRDAGLEPGRDIAVAGFDDVGPAVDVAPALTTVAVPLRRVGRTAMKLALDKASAQTVARIPTNVVLRDSTPPR